MGVKELFGLHAISGSTTYFVEGLFTTFTQIGWKKDPKTNLPVLEKRIDPETKQEIITQVDDPTQPGAVILIDEVTALDPGKNFIFHQILAERKFFVRDANKTYYVAPRVMIMFAGNPKDPRYPGVNKMNLAFADRLGSIYLDALSMAQVQEYITKAYGDVLNADQIKFILDYVADMRDFIKSGSDPIGAELSMRSIKRMASFLAKGASYQDAVEYGFLNTYLAHDKEAYDAMRGHSASSVPGWKV
jgi:MoxR-like ATPase